MLNPNPEGGPLRSGHPTLDSCVSSDSTAWPRPSEKHPAKPRHCAIPTGSHCCSTRRPATGVAAPISADAIFDHIVHDAHRINLTGHSLRRSRAPPRSRRAQRASTIGSTAGGRVRQGCSRGGLPRRLAPGWGWRRGWRGWGLARSIRPWPWRLELSLLLVVLLGSLHRVERLSVGQHLLFVLLNCPWMMFGSDAPNATACNRTVLIAMHHLGVASLGKHPPPIPARNRSAPAGWTGPPAGAGLSVFSPHHASRGTFLHVRRAGASPTFRPAGSA
jgi:hypothetical protein